MERKVRLDSGIAEYPCTLVVHRPPLLVIRYVFTRGRGETYETPIPLPDGTVSHGFFWTDRPYNAYRMRGPEGDLIAHRFDAVADVMVEPGGVTYRDLIVDWWLIPGRPLIEEDREDFEAALAAGRVAAGDAGAVESATGILTTNLDRVLAELAALEASLS